MRSCARKRSRAAACHTHVPERFLYDFGAQRTKIRAAQPAQSSNKLRLTKPRSVCPPAAAAAWGQRQVRKAAITRHRRPHITHNQSNDRSIDQSIDQSISAASKQCCAHFFARLPAPFLGGALPRRRIRSSFAFALHNQKHGDGQHLDSTRARSTLATPVCSAIGWGTTHFSALRLSMRGSFALGSSG